MGEDELAWLELDEQYGAEQQRAAEFYRGIGIVEYCRNMEIERMLKELVDSQQRVIQIGGE